MSLFAGSSVRRAAAAVVAAGAVGAGAVVLTGPVAPTGAAAPDPCAASEIAKTAGSVATNTGTYLDTHPQTNQAITMIGKQQSGPQSFAALKSYFDANPMVAADLQRLQQPLVSLGSRCQLPVSLPQLLGLVQAAQPTLPAQPGQPAAPTQPASPASSFLTNG